MSSACSAVAVLPVPSSPDGFVGKDDFAEILGAEVEESLFDLFLDNLVICAVLSFLEHLADAEDRSKIVFKSKSHFLAKSL